MTLNLNIAALALGKKRLSPQTKFLQHFPQKDAQIHHTIPLFENFCFALSLFRSKEIDNIELALDLLDRCLRFQTDSGSFPRFVHEYPLDHLYLNSIDILNAFFWIEKEFKKVMQNSLKEKLDRSIGLLIDFCESKKAFFPKSSLFRFEVLKHAFQNSNFNFEENFSCEFFYSKDELKDLLLSLQVFDLENKNKLSKKIWERLLELYHPNLYSYIGPADNVFQNQYNAEIHLADLFFLALIKAEGKVDPEDPVFLCASLIRPIINIDSAKLEEGRSFGNIPAFEIEKLDQKWVGLNDKNYCLTSVEKGFAIDKMYYGFHLFKAIFGNSRTINSLVCQHCEAEYSCKLDGKNSAEMEFLLLEDIKEDEFELKFFVENQGCEIFVNDIKATAFGFDDRISIQNEGAKAVLSFELLDKDAKFCGHILRGNRPSQLSCRKDKFTAYDYMLSLRTITRLSKCRIKAKLEFYPSEV